MPPNSWGMKLRAVFSSDSFFAAVRSGILRTNSILYGYTGMGARNARGYTRSGQA